MTTALSVAFTAAFRLWGAFALMYGVPDVVDGIAHSEGWIAAVWGVLLVVLLMAGVGALMVDVTFRERTEA